MTGDSNNKTNIEHANVNKHLKFTDQTQMNFSTPKKNDKVAMDELEDQLEKAGVVQPPDGDYGWMIVFASFCTNAIVDGIIFTVSASLVPRWEQYFQSGAVTSITALLAGFYLLSGPLASALANNFGCNIVAIAGAFVASIGFLISALIPALPVVYFAFGIIGGVGFGLVFLPAIVIVGQYFSEKRALATGIAVCGSGIGTAIFGQLNPILLNYFDTIAGKSEGWRLFLFFLSCVTLFSAVFGYFFKPLKPSKQQLEQVVRLATEYMGTIDELSGKITDEPLLSRQEEHSLIAMDNIQPGRVANGIEIERFGNSAHNYALMGTVRGYHSNYTYSQRPFLSTLELMASRQTINKKPSTSNANLAMEISKVGVHDLNRPLSRMDVFYTGSTINLPDRISKKVIQRDVDTINDAAKPVAVNGSRPTLYLSNVALQNLEEEAFKRGGISSRWTRGIITSLRSMLDMSLLKSATFIILAFSGFLTLFCFFVPFAFVGALADERIGKNSNNKNNMVTNSSFINAENDENSFDESNAQLLLVLLGLFNVIGRVLCGFVSDHPRVDPLAISNFALILGGLATAVAPLFDRLWMFAFYCLPFAFGAASFAALRSIICVELLGIERLTSAFGMLMLFMGVAALLGPPFAKFLKNMIGSYSLSFHIMGVLMAASGAMCIPLRRINAWENKHHLNGSKNGNALTEELELQMQPLNNDDGRQQ